MSDFEKKYYEAPGFWVEGALGDKSNQVRIETTVDMIPGDVRSLADIGCGNGIFGNYLMQKRPEISIMSIDRSEMALSYVKTQKKLGSIDNIPLENNSYDCVTCLQVLEHLPVHVYDQSLSELARISNKYVLISVPFNEDLQLYATQCPQCLSVFNADLHLRNYDVKAIDQLFTKYGFDCIGKQNIIPMEVLSGIEFYQKLKKFICPPKKSFTSPICPICGYENATFKSEVPVTTTSQPNGSIVKKAFRPVKGFLKSIWPKKTLPGYWIIGLYRKR